MAGSAKGGNRGRAFRQRRIDGFRITVQDVYHYLEHGCTPESITSVGTLTLGQIHGAIAFVDAHKKEMPAARVV